MLKNLKKKQLSQKIIDRASLQNSEQSSSKRSKLSKDVDAVNYTSRKSIPGLSSLNVDNLLKIDDTDQILEVIV